MIKHEEPPTRRKLDYTILEGCPWALYYSRRGAVVPWYDNGATLFRGQVSDFRAYCEQRLGLTGPDVAHMLELVQ